MYNISSTYCKSCLNFNGEDGSTTILDVTGRQWVAHGNAQLDTSQYKYGTASCLFDGSGDYISTAHSADLVLGANNFTFASWIRVAAFPSQYAMIYAKRGSNITFSGLLVALTASGFLSLFASSTGTNWDLLTGATLGITISLNTWHHLAVVRNGSTWTGYLDGTAGTTPRTASGALCDGGDAMTLGGEIAGSFYFNGWLDDCFLLNGQALWTNNFSPPAAEISVIADPACYLHARRDRMNMKGVSTQNSLA